MRKPLTKKGLANDIKQNVTTDLNRLVRIVVRQLPAQSPQYTGFFASSWKASTTRPRAIDRVEDFSPWDRIKKEKDKNPSVQARVQPRFTVPRFSFNDTVFIGNTAVYARYALASPSNTIPAFVQGEMRYLVDFIFGDKKRPDVRVAASPLGFDGEDLSSVRGSRYMRS
jgi:hypothetical protein